MGVVKAISRLKKFLWVFPGGEKGTGRSTLDHDLLDSVSCIFSGFYGIEVKYLKTISFPRKTKGQAKRVGTGLN